MRIKGGTVTHARHKKILKSTKGYRGRQNSSFRIAKQANMKAGKHAYIGRKLKKRTYRALWIQRLNAAVRAAGLTYSRFIDGLTKSKVAVNRKSLSELAINEPKAFEKIVEMAKGKASSPVRK